jgi:uncharacterized repeat protein (TIGR01451 family)
MNAKNGLFTLLCLICSLQFLTNQEALAGPPIPVSVTITKVTCVDPCRNVGLEGAGESAPDFYAKITVNGATTRTIRAPDDQDDIEPLNWIASSTVPDTQPNFPVSIQIWDADGFFGGSDDLADASPVNGKNNLDFTVDRVTGRWTGDVTWPQGCVNGAGNDEPKVRVCFDVSVISQGGDADGDGLLDGWEKNGLDTNGDSVIDVNLPAMGANPLHKDLFLELDSEAGQAPTRAGIQAMKRAFAAAPFLNLDNTTGINLWVDTGNVVDPTANEAAPVPNCGDGFDNDGDLLIDGADPDCTGGNGANRRYLDSSSEGPPPSNCGDNKDNDSDGAIDGADSGCLVGDNAFANAPLGGGSTIPTVGACRLDGSFYTAKQNNFSPLRRWVFRYAISGIQPGTCPNVTSGSCQGQRIGGCGETGGNDFVEFNHDGGTVMHEFGHTLNLQHGGNDGTNCKPNYVSVMNYDNQFGINRVLGGRVIDYSPPRIALNGSGRGVAPLNQLVENSLNENNILDSSDTTNRFVFSFGAGGTANIVQANLNTNPNWNRDTNDPPFENPVTANVDNGSPGCANTSTNDTLNGFNDWQFVSLPFRQFGDSSSGAINAVSDNEPTLEQLIEHDDALHRTNLSVSLTDTPDPVAAGTRLTYKVIVKNQGPNPASSVQLVNTLPTEVTLVNTPAGCSVAGRVITCNLGELVAGSNAAVTISVDVPADLVYNHGSPLTITNHAEVHNLTGQEVLPSDNAVDETTRVVAVADLSLRPFSVPNPPIAMQVKESVVVGLHSTITSEGPSSPMDTALELSAKTSSGATIMPTQLTTIQPHLTKGEIRPVHDHVTIRCDRPGNFSFEMNHRIRPLQAVDTDPNPSNNEQPASIQVECSGAEEVTINILPGHFPNIVSPHDLEIPVGIMTTKDGEYGRPGFDASKVIQDSVRFGPPTIVTDNSLGTPAYGKRGEMIDVAEPIPPETKLDDDPDLMMIFDLKKAELRIDDKEPGACVIGLFKDHNGHERQFFGCDSLDKPDKIQNPPTSKDNTNSPGFFEWLLLIAVLLLLLLAFLWPQRLAK